ncbi:hypothetical protein GmHk_03G006933 [Glycine max]|nr:hypothetical protein GmHk_03G006933 [Glycine max]
MAQHATRHNSAVCWFYCRDETNDVRPDAVRGAASRSKNALGNRTDIGWKHRTNVLLNGKKFKCNYCSKINNGGIFRFKHHLVGTRWDSKSCASVPEEVEMLMMKVVAEVANASKKRRKLNSIHEEGIHAEGVESNTTQSGIEGKGMLAFIGRGKQNLFKLVYTSAIPFNVIKNPAFVKFCDMVARYGVGYKPLSYHDIREKLLKREVEKTDVMLQEFKDKLKKTGCTIMSDGRSICNFLVNNPKGTVFLYSLDTSDISKIADKVLKMLNDVVNFVGEENVVQTTIKNGRRITTYIYGRTMLISIMKNFTNGRDLIRPGMTRFATTYLTLACLHELKASLMSMLSSQEWKTSKFGTSQEWRKIENMALDSWFWKNGGFRCKTLHGIFDIYVLCIYEPVWKIIDERWDHKVHKPLHAAAYYLNPHLHYEPTFRHDDPQVKEGLHIGLFSMEEAKDSRKVMQPGEWWEMFGDGTLELRRFVVRVQQKMNDLVYVMYNSKLESKKNRKTIALPLDEIEFDDEWITEKGYNDEDEQPRGEGDGGNVELVGDVRGSSNDLVVDAFDLDNLILVEPYDDAQSEEDLDDDGEGDESADIHGDDPIRGLDMLSLEYLPCDLMIKICIISGAKRSSCAKRTLWAQRTSIAKCSFSTLSMTRESGRAQESRPHTKREISLLSETFVSCQAQHTTDTKPKSTYSC